MNLGRAAICARPFSSIFNKSEAVADQKIFIFIKFLCKNILLNNETNLFLYKNYSNDFFFNKNLYKNSLNNKSEWWNLNVKCLFLYSDE